MLDSKLTIFYSGGLEILFGNERKHKISLPGQLDNGAPSNISYLLQYLVDNLMKDQRKELFIMEDNVYVHQDSESPQITRSICLRVKANLTLVVPVFLF